MNNSLIFQLLFWGLILPVFFSMNHIVLKLVILSFGIVHALYSPPWPEWCLFLAYVGALILFIVGYKNKCYLAMVIGSIVFIGHYLKDSGILPYYYFPSN